MLLWTTADPKHPKREGLVGRGGPGGVGLAACAYLVGFVGSNSYSLS